MNGLVQKARLAGWGSAIAALIAALALTVAGCGGSAAADDSASSSSGPSAPNGQRPQFDQGAFTQLRECLEKNGVTLPSPGQGGPPSGGQGGPPSGGQGPPALSGDAQKAFQACSQYLPSSPQGQGGLFNG